MDSILLSLLSFIKVIHTCHNLIKVYRQPSPPYRQAIILTTTAGNNFFLLATDELHVTSLEWWLILMLQCHLFPRLQPPDSFPFASYPQGPTFGENYHFLSKYLPLFAFCHADLLSNLFYSGMPHISIPLPKGIDESKWLDSGPLLWCSYVLTHWIPEKILHRSQFRSWLHCFCSSSLMVCLGRQWGTTHVLGLCQPQGRPKWNSRLLTWPDHASAAVTIWGVNQEMKISNFLCKY